MALNDTTVQCSVLFCLEYDWEQDRNLTYRGTINGLYQAQPKWELLGKKNYEYFQSVQSIQSINSGQSIQYIQSIQGIQYVRSIQSI